mmetsp:Transcript_40232/g.70777  ORF Transcript_40232/g.70777 Transcript_40232/m.70777 type:complete len:202 (+) Transcript_40232:225-830(+)
MDRTKSRRSTSPATPSSSRSANLSSSTEARKTAAERTWTPFLPPSVSSSSASAPTPAAVHAPTTTANTLSTWTPTSRPPSATSRRSKRSTAIPVTSVTRPPLRLPPPTTMPPRRTRTPPTARTWTPAAVTPSARTLRTWRRMATTTRQSSPSARSSITATTMATRTMSEPCALPTEAASRLACSLTKIAPSMIPRRTLRTT